MQIVNCALEDFETVFGLYDQAIEYQKTKFDKHWLGFSVSLVNKEIEENRLWKIIIDDNIACIFSVTYSDPLIWKEKNDEPSLYIHRIVTNPLFRGRGFVTIIVEWAKEFGRNNGKKFIRMDTWGDNQKLIDYYTACGFNFLGLTTPTKTKDLPKHYEGVNLSLFEMTI